MGSTGFKQVPKRAFPTPCTVEQSLFLHRAPRFTSSTLLGGRSRRCSLRSSRGLADPFVVRPGGLDNPIPHRPR